MAITTFRVHDAYIGSDFDIQDAIMISGNKRGFYCVDAGSLDEVRVSGRGLSYQNGLPSRGIIDQVTFVDANGDLLVTISNLKLKAGQVAGDSVIEFFRDILTKETVLPHKFIGSNGDDTAFGSTKSDILLGGKGNDTLDGGLGRDKLIGGLGEDTFVFAEGYGKDVLVDFDANGSDGSQDLIATAFPGAAAISRSGKNTVVDFGDGDVLTLLHVRPAQIDASDFI